MQQSMQRKQVDSRGPNRRPCRTTSVQRVRQVVRASAAAAAANAPLKIMISGAPAAGKGTQCAKIIEKFNLVHISAGDLLREQVAQQTPAGARAKGFMDKGLLVPDEVVVDMVKHVLASPAVLERGWLLDGYPRSASQAEAIEREGIRPDLFLLIKVPDEFIVERVCGRRLDPVTGDIYHLKFKPPPADVLPRLTQRSDDTEDKCRTRLATYHSNVNAVLDYYTDITVEIDGNRSMDAVFSSVARAIKDLIEKRGDPLEAYCADLPEADECRVYE